MSETDIDRIHLVFKTHLDLGFTDFAGAVMHRYITEFIPQALRLARQLRESDKPERFIWTTGSWLVDTYLEMADPSARREMEQAIEAGDIVWHALPFTTHTELMDDYLFLFGLDISHQLDARFGRKTIAAKMTDVPGHTRGIVPLMADAGIEFFHVGVNEASSVPDVPPLFRWLDEASGKSIIVAYSANYGEETLVPSLHTGLAFAFTGDNIGPPNAALVESYYAKLRARYPNANVRASTLDAFAIELRQVRDSLPVITSEIGDTWIHGVGSDPTKMRQFRNLNSLRRHWIRGGAIDLESPQGKAFSKHLMCVTEHTWGLDVKTHMTNFNAYKAADFAVARQADDAKKMEHSWQEQRHYLDLAAEALAGTDLQADALWVLAPLKPPTAIAGDVVNAAQRFETPRFDIGFDPHTGAINYLHHRQQDRVWADADHPLALYRYETFSQADYDRYWTEYIRNKARPDVVAWAQHDYMKTGLGNQAETHRLVPSELIEMRRSETETETRFDLLLGSRPDLMRDYGAPEHVLLTVICEHNWGYGDTITVELSWESKPVCRMPEAAWMSFSPLQAEDGQWLLRKLGSWIDPLDVVRCGGRWLHAVDGDVDYQDAQTKLMIHTSDAPLVSVGEPSLLRFPNAQPDPRGGVHINLYNNKWSTNFPQWIEGAARYRFDLKWRPA